MNFFRKKTVPHEFELAQQFAKDCQFELRPGDPETDFAFLQGGVRVIVYEFGEFQPFVLGRTTKDWIKERFKLTDLQTQSIMELMRTRARKFIREVERRRITQSQGIGGPSMADRLHKQWFG